jgi:hypothetical protein
MNLSLVGSLALASPLASEFLISNPWLGLLAYLCLVFTPGAYIAFGIPLKGISFSIKLCLAVILSPTIVCAEFYALRLFGVPFSTTAVALVFLNLPATYLIWKARKTIQNSGRAVWLTAAVCIVVPIACLYSVITNIDARIYSGAAWLHADATYMFVRGDLVPESPTLAGLRMAYPVWSGLVFEAIHSYLTQAPPQSTYVWSNLFILIAACGLAAGIAKELGGKTAAQASAPIFLLLGTNPLGYFLVQFFPLQKLPQIWGDERYTPWVNKFMLFGPMTMGIVMTMAIIYLLVRPGSLTREVLFVVGLLLCSIGLFYPLLFPPACGLMCARALAGLLVLPHQNRKLHVREILSLAALVLLATVLTYTEVHFMTSDRHNSSSEVLLSSLPGAAKKLFAAGISTALLLCGAALSFRHLWPAQRRAIVFLFLGSAASFLLYAVFFIPFYSNEYKFIFTAAMCLAVFPAIALEQIWQSWPRARAIPLLLLLLLLPIGAYADWAYRNWPAPWLGAHVTSRSYQQTYDPPLSSDGFFLSLSTRDPRFAICNAVRTMTPDRSVLLVDDSEIYYPELTSRSLFVSAQNRSYPGVNLWADALDIEVGGYGAQVLAERRATLTDFFDSKDAQLREDALHSIQQLKRPVAVVVDQTHSELLNWLKVNNNAHELFLNNGLSLWLIDFPGTRP